MSKTANRNLFLVNTPMQLVNAVALATTVCKEEKSDVYYTSNITDAVKSFVKDGIFINGYEMQMPSDLCPRSNAITKALVRIKNALDLRWIIKHLPSDARLYKRVFLSGINLKNCEFYYAISKVNKSVELNLYEEGICEYTCYKKKSVSKALFSYFFFGKFYLSSAKKMYVYMPELVKCAWENIEIQKLELVRQDELVACFNRAFGYERTLLHDNKKIVILEQEFYGAGENEKQREIIDAIAESVGEDRILIKLHPRAPKDKYGEVYKTIDIKAPFEVVAMNEYVFDNIFVSVSSSAILNLNFLFGKIPKMLMLNRIFRINQGDQDRVDTFMEDVKKLYASDTYFIPETMEECINNIDCLVNKL